MIPRKWVLPVLCLSLLAMNFADNSVGDFPATTFSGRITDVDTGKPIVNATIYFHNGSMNDFFSGMSNEEGFFSVEVGGGGIYEIAIFHSAYEIGVASIDISHSEEKRIDLVMRHFEDNCNIKILRGGRNTPFEGATVDLRKDVPNGSAYAVTADAEGLANITIPSGNYTMNVQYPHYRAHIRPIYVTPEHYAIEYVNLHPSSVGSNAPLTLIDDSYPVPARSALVIKISSSEDYSLFYRWRSGLNVDSYTVPGDTLDGFMDWIKAGSIDNGSAPQYDFGLTGGMSGSMTCSTWTDPYYLVIVNNESEPTDTQITVKYEYGTFELSEPYSEPLYPDIDDEAKRIERLVGSLIAGYFAVMIAIILTLLFFGIRKDKMEEISFIGDRRPHRRNPRSVSGRSGKMAGRSVEWMRR